MRRAAGKLGNNAGSAGRPVGSRLVPYAYFICSTGGVEAELARVGCPVGRVVAEIDRLGLPSELRNVYPKGHCLP